VREPSVQPALASSGGDPGGRYKWVALSNTTLSVTMATIDASIVIISMPAIFRGIHLNPLAPGNVSYLLWMIIGYLLLGGVLAASDWRSVFWINVPIGVFGTIWSYRSLREIAATRRARIDWAGNVTFALGAGLLLVAITYGIQPYGGHPTGWTSRTCSAACPPGWRC
jgi:MFS family permease